MEAYIDGRCKPNPDRTCAYGVLVKEGEEVVWEDSGIVGKGEGMSDNVGEYAALIRFLEWLEEKDIEEKVDVLSDSQVLPLQMAGYLKVVDASYATWFEKAKVLAKGQGNLRFRWIPRKKNIASELVEEELNGIKG